MDPVQELLERVGQAQVDSSPCATPSTSASATTRRTKMVFVYSDEDEDGEVHTNGDVSTGEHTAAARGIAEVTCDSHAIALSEDALAELRADAHAIDARLNDVQDADVDDLDSARGPGGMGGLFFQEDVLSGLGAAASAPGLTAALAGGMRVREVDAPTLWDGAFATTSGRDGIVDNGGAPEMPALLRRGLPAATFVLESRRKRFRDT